MSDENRMTFTEHLSELRTRIIRSMLAIVLAFIIAYALSNHIFQLLSYPLDGLRQAGMLAEEAQAKAPASAQWTVLNPLEPLLVKMKLAAYAGLLMALPYIVYQVCAFIFPGLTPGERRMARFLIIGSALFVVFGVAVAYFGVFPMILPYMLQWVPQGVQVQFRMNETISLIIKGLAAFAISFQFPMVVMVLVYLGVLTPETLKRYRRFAIVGLSAAAALLTPPDPLSMVIMLIPLIILYELSIWLSHIVVRYARKGEAEHV